MATSKLFDSILLMGPRGTGKTATSDILSRRLGINSLNSDFYIRKNIQTEKELVLDEKLFDEKFIMADVRSLEVFKIAFLRELLCNFSKRIVIDLSNPFGAFSNKAYLMEAKEILELFNNKFILIPSPDIEESMKILQSRKKSLTSPTEEGVMSTEYQAFRSEVINRYFLTSSDLDQYNLNIIYTKDKSPMIVADEILQFVKK